MRCITCNRLLTDKEATMRHPETGQYLDTCEDCIEVLAEDCPEIYEGLLDFDDDLDEETPQEVLDLRNILDHRLDD